MDINAIIKENLPDGVEMSDKAINLIAKEIKQQQGDEFIPKTSYSKLSDKVVDLESKIAELEGNGAEADSYKTKVTELETKISEMETTHAEALQAKDTELSDYKAGVESEKTTSAKNTALRKALVASGVRDDALILDALAGKFSLDAVEIEDGSIKGWDKLLEPVKAEHSGYFGTVKDKPLDVANPPARNETEKDPFIEGFDGK